MKRLVLSVAVLGLCLGAVHRAEAGVVTDTFTFYDGASTSASGTFSYDSSLQGSVLGYNDLLSFSLTTIVPNTYDLAFLNSGGFGDFYYFQFDTAALAFNTTNINGFETLIAAIKDDFSSGFFVLPLSVPNAGIGDYNPFTVATYDRLVITTDAVSVSTPEPATVASAAIALLTGGLAYRRRRRA